MAATKSRRGSKKSGTSKKSAAAKAAPTNGGEERLTPAEKRLEGVALGDRRKAVKMARSGESIDDIASMVGLSPVKTKFLIMQQRVEDGDVSEVKADDKSILKALQTDDGYNSVDWVSCRARVAGGKVKAVADAAGHEFSRGAPRQKSPAKKGSAKKSSGAAAVKSSSKRARKAAPEPETRARRGKGRPGRKSRPNA